jgi:kynurenine formamidase
VPTVGPALRPGADGVQLRVFQGADARDASDTQVLAPHGFDVTHLDAVGHSFYKGAAYNERRMDDVVRPEGLACCGIEALAGGIVTRAVVLDVLGGRDNVPLAPDEGISARDLDHAELSSGAQVLPGDAVLVRSGVSGPDVGGRRPGLLASAVGWLHDHQVAVYGGDCIERFPGEDPSVPMVLHQVGHVSMGLVILDNVDMEAARVACNQYGRQIFLLVLAALPIAGATGCAVNPLAVF